jgi:hypothetical protein
MNAPDVTDGPKQLKGSTHADHPLTLERRVVVCEKVEKPLEIGERTSPTTAIKTRR